MRSRLSGRVCRGDEECKLMAQLDRVTIMVELTLESVAHNGYSESVIKHIKEGRYTIAVLNEAELPLSTMRLCGPSRIIREAYDPCDACSQDERIQASTSC